MAPIRDWTGAITISPLPYCEIAAGGFGVGIATTAPPRLSTPALEVGSFSTCGRALCVGVCLNERAVDNGKILYVIWWWNGKKFVTLRYQFGVAPIRKRAMKRESGENPEQTELLYASTFNPIACSLPC